MSFKKSIGLTAFLALAFAARVFAGMPQDIMQPNIVGFGQETNSRVSSTPVIMIDWDGDLIPAKNLELSIGESTRAFKQGHFGTLNVTSGIVNIHEEFVDLASASLNGAGLSSVGFSFTTDTLRGSTNTAIVADGQLRSPITQSSGAPRNLVVWAATSAVSGWNGASIGTQTLCGTATFYGFDAFGDRIVEVIRFSTRNIGDPGLSGSTNTVANSSDVVRYTGVGNHAWAYVSSFTVRIDSITNTYTNPTIVIKIGFGNKIGLANNVTSTADIYKVSDVGGADVTDPIANPAVVLDATYDTVTFPTAPNGINEKRIWYKVRQGRQ